MTAFGKKLNMLCRRLRSRRGTSLAELLVTVVLIGLITMAVAVGVATVANSYEKVVLRADAETMLNTTVNVLRDELTMAISPQTDEDSLEFISGNSGIKLRITTQAPEGTTQATGISLQYLNNDGSENSRIFVADEKSRDKNLYPTFDSIEVAANGTITVGNLRVLHGTHVLAVLNDGDSNLVVTPLNK